MELFGLAYDDVRAIEREEDNLTVDQRLKIAEIKALLAVSQELSKIRQHGVNPVYDPHDTTPDR